MKRRLITTIIAALAAILCAFVFVACGSGKEDTHPDDTSYNGALSETAYDSPELAARAFIDIEVCGDVTAATFVSYTKTADLTDEEMQELDIPDEQRAEIASAEKGEVKYSVASDASVHTSASDEKSYSVVIVKYGDQTVKYYSPKLNSGDPLTKSYYDKIFSYENFNNVTLRYKLDLPIDVDISGFKFTIKVSMKIDAKWDDDTYGYVKSESILDCGSFGAMAGIGNNNRVVSELVYVNDKTSRFYKCSFSRNIMSGETTDWTLNGSPKAPDWSYDSDGENDEYDLGLGDVDESDVLYLFTPAFDYSYFVKTKTGFKINSEKLTEYLNIAIKDAFEKSSLPSMGMKLGKTTASANYYVSDGKITESVIKLNCKYSLNINGAIVDYYMKEKIVAKYTDYGTTVVTIPSDLDFNRYL